MRGMDKTDLVDGEVLRRAWGRSPESALVLLHLAFDRPDGATSEELLSFLSRRRATGLEAIRGALESGAVTAESLDGRGRVTGKVRASESFWVPMGTQTGSWVPMGTQGGNKAFDENGSKYPRVLSSGSSSGSPEPSSEAGFPGVLRKVAETPAEGAETGPRPETSGKSGINRTPSSSYRNSKEEDGERFIPSPTRGRPRRSPGTHRVARWMEKAGGGDLWRAELARGLELFRKRRPLEVQSDGQDAKLFRELKSILSVNAEWLPSLLDPAVVRELVEAGDWQISDRERKKMPGVAGYGLRIATSARRILQGIKTPGMAKTEEARRREEFRRQQAERFAR